MVLARLTPTEGTAEASRQSYLFRRIGWFDTNTAALFRRIGWFDPNTAALSLWLRLSSLDHDYGHGPDPDPSWPDDLQDRPTAAATIPILALHGLIISRIVATNISVVTTVVLGGSTRIRRPSSVVLGGSTRIRRPSSVVWWSDPNTAALYRRIGWFDPNTSAPSRAYCEC